MPKNNLFFAIHILISGCPVLLSPSGVFQFGLVNKGDPGVSILISQDESPQGLVVYFVCAESKAWHKACSDTGLEKISRFYSANVVGEEH